MAYIAWNTSGTSEQEIFDSDEAMNETERDRENYNAIAEEEEPTRRGSAEEESQQERGTPDMSFQAIDTPLSLGDIVISEQEGKRPRKVKPKPLTTDQPGTSQPPKRSSSRYNLRLKPAKRKIFGWSSEKKK